MKHNVVFIGLTQGESCVKSHEKPFRKVLNSYFEAQFIIHDNSSYLNPIN